MSGQKGLLTKRTLDKIHSDQNFLVKTHIVYFVYSFSAFFPTSWTKGKLSEVLPTAALCIKRLQIFNKQAHSKKGGLTFRILSVLISLYHHSYSWAVKRAKSYKMSITLKYFVEK
jgi:hypothetical protein